MYPSQFEYIRAGSVQEAVQLLGQNPDAKILAGGHSLIPALKLRLAAPSAVIDIARISSLRGISVSGGAATIGAMTTYHDLLTSSALKSAFPVIAETAYLVGDPAVRSRGTLGGSLAHADPAADFPAVIIALKGSVTATGPNGERTIAIDDLLVDLFTTSLESDEILTSISLPAMASGAKAAYEKHAHPASGYAVAGVAAAITISGGTITAASVGVTGAGPVASRANATEAALVGKAATAETIAAAAALAADGVDLNGDVYASAEYRGHLLTVLAKRAITRAAAR